ncbi:hypothetical protein A5893_05465 [Pedobacter psychrophilus]|uniref:Uncharacterized protein n=1 Tax=Pedobacter psychrophilus TaxID=1826909 RepID=A0A179DH47_9SPHI|nr:hypothetical protein A5893_05465 [Pedobacter psychrophilus]
MNNKKRNFKKIEEKDVSVLTKIIVLIAIIFFLYLMYRFGGPGQTWYPGKPYYEDNSFWFFNNLFYL